MPSDSEQTLLAKYAELFKPDKYPCWAHRYPPPIPFIGRRFGEAGVRVLVYASAENLTYTRKEPNPEIDRLSVAEQSNRHRVLYERRGREHYFPFIHLQPINDGSLLTVTRHLLDKLDIGATGSSEPHEFIEQIAVGNLGKFSIDPRLVGLNEKRNRDYASDPSKLAASVDYIVADITTIRPDMVILPRTIFNAVNRSVGWRKLLGDRSKRSPIRFFKIFQANARVINTHITRRLKGVPVYDYRNSSIGPWLERSTVQRLDRYLAWLDLMLEQHRGEIEECFDDPRR